MSRLHSITLFLALAVLTAFSPRLPAQAKPPEAVKEVPAPDVVAAWNRRLRDLSLDDLPLAEVVKMLRQSFPELNFVLKGEGDRMLDGISIRLTLRSVTLDEILKALQLAYEGRLHIRFGSSAPEEEQRHEDERLVIFEKPVPRGVVGHPVVARAYNLTRYLDRPSVKETDEAMAALEQAIHLAGEMMTKVSGGDREFHPEMSLHRGTKLLIVAGRPEEVSLVEEIVQGLQGAAPESRIILNQQSVKPAPTAKKPAGDAKPAQ